VPATRPGALAYQSLRREPSTQNSSSPGSARTIGDCSPWPMSARVAPSDSNRPTSRSRSSGRKSRWRRFLVVLPSGTGTNRSPGVKSPLAGFPTLLGLHRRPPSRAPLATMSPRRQDLGRRCSPAPSPTSGYELDDSRVRPCCSDVDCAIHLRLCPHAIPGRAGL